METRYKPDLFAFGCIVVELKAVAELVRSTRGTVDYIRIAHQPVGYLVNFGHKGELQWKRFILSDCMKKRERNTNLR